MLFNKNILITGCNRGIGEAILRICAAQRAEIWAHSRTESSGFLDTIQKLSEKYSVKIHPVFFDMTDYAAMKAFVKALISSQKHIDGLVNNAGITDNALFQMSGESMLRNEFETNVFSLFFLTQHILKIMLKQHSGSIVNISSVSGLRGDVGRTVYGMTKAAVASFTQSLAAEVGKSGVRVNAVAPGFIQTDMMAKMQPEIIEKNLEQSKLGRIGLPEEVAKSVVFLLSEQSSYITGEIIRVTGGLA